MPPRKRAESAPKDESAKELAAAPGDEATEQPAEGVADASAPASDAAPPSDGSVDQAPPVDGDGDGDQKPDESGPDPERSDLQTAEQPCEECCPNGWPEGAFSVGCTHGTWIRDNT